MPSPRPEVPCSQQVNDILSAYESLDIPPTTVADWLWYLADDYPLLLDGLVSPADAHTIRTSSAVVNPHFELNLGLDAEGLREAAVMCALAKGDTLVLPIHLLTVAVQKAGYIVERRDKAASPVPLVPPPSAAQRPAVIVPSEAALSWTTRATRPTPTLDALGIDLTRRALEGKLEPMIGRTRELDRMLLTLCRVLKPNPLLVGAAGTGKTAIVEGLAQRLIDGDVPDAIQGSRLIALQPSSLIAGIKSQGEFEQRTRAVISEASQPGIILFIDEIHTALGAGGAVGTTDVAQLLKPALARGDFACIAATTDDEYRLYIEPDEALARRFDTIKVHELSEGETLTVLERRRMEPRFGRGVSVADDALRCIVEFCTRNLRNRRFPDKAVDLLDHIIAAAKLDGGLAVSAEFAISVANELHGVTTSTEESLASLSDTLRSRGLMNDADALALTDRLAVTTRGLDIADRRPNAVVVLAGSAASLAEPMGEALAECMYGAPTRVVSIDFATLGEEHSVTRLIGSPLSYKDSGMRHALDAVGETPRTVVIAKDFDLAHTVVRQTFRGGLDAGHITDLRGRRIYFSDAIVLITTRAVGEPETQRNVIGYTSAWQPEGDATDSAAALTTLLGDDAVSLVDLVLHDRPADNADQRSDDWLQLHVLRAFEERLEARKITVIWDSSLLQWLRNIDGGAAPAPSLVRRIERDVLPMVAAQAYPPQGTSPQRTFVVQRVNEGIAVTGLE